MDVEKLAKNFAAFLTHHSGELRLIGSALETVITHLPIDQQDKDRIVGVADQLQTAAGNIAAGAAALAGTTGDEAGEVVVDRADVEAAVGDYLEAHPGVVAEAEAGNAAAGEGPANA